MEVIRYSEAGDSAIKAKAFLVSKFNKATVKPSYLLLAGNASTLPAFTEITSRGAALSDYAYTVFEDGEILPNILQGRLLANNLEEARTQIERWISYEKYCGRRLVYQGPHHRQSRRF